MSTPVTRIWSDEFVLLYSSETDPRTPGQFMRDQAVELELHRIERNYTVDHGEPRSFATREGGRIIWANGHCSRTPHMELLKHLLTPPLILPAFEEVDVAARDRMAPYLAGDAAFGALASAIACFGPGTTAGGRAEAGWRDVGTIAEDGIQFKPRNP